MHRYIFLTFLTAALITHFASLLPAAAEDLEVYTHRLSQSTADYTFWTSPPSRRVFKTDSVPIATADAIQVYIAKNEFEPFQVVVRPSHSVAAPVTMGSFGSSITSEIYQVKYVDISQPTDNLGTAGANPDPLWPLANGATVNLSAGANTAFWFNIFAPSTTPAGNYTTHVNIDGINIPIRLHVFDFAIAKDLHVASQMNFSHEAMLSKYSVPGYGSEYWSYVDKMKKFFIDHRLTPSSPLWSGGLTSGTAPYIDYDCNGNFTDNDSIWGFEAPAARYLQGSGLMEGIFSQPFNNGTGFSSFMAVSFRNNDAAADQRPDSFCSQSRSPQDWYSGNNPDSPYNLEWRQYMHGIEDYLSGLNLLDKAYYYIANEPQGQTGYNAVAWYSQTIKSAAPNLKLMVSEEPKAEIYNHPIFTGAKIDIWLPVLHNFNPEISQDREQNHGEESWVYFLHGTRPPFFNPITLDHPGLESKLTGWFLWKYRLRGIAYYSLNNWDNNPWTEPMTDGHNGDTFLLYPPSETNTAIAYGANGHRFVPSIRFELMRDSLEDYEYLYVLNNNHRPEVASANQADLQAGKIITGLTSYTRDDDFIYNLRRLIGLKNGGEIASIPDIQPPARHPRCLGSPQDYFINFQNPSGEPLANPLVVNGHAYVKIGWNTYDAVLGYGWYGDMAHVMYQFLNDGPNLLQKSILYDDWGRQKTFEFDLPNGEYEVTVSVGWYNRSYAHHKIDIEGIPFIEDEGTTPTSPYLVRTQNVAIHDNALTMSMGIFDEYTMLNYLDIRAVVPVFAAGDLNCSGKIDLADVIGILRIVNNSPLQIDSSCPSLQGDLNGNGRIGMEDAIGTLNSVAVFE